MGETKVVLTGIDVREGWTINGVQVPRDCVRKVTDGLVEIDVPEWVSEGDVVVVRYNRPADAS